MSAFQIDPSRLAERLAGAPVGIGLERLLIEILPDEDRELLRKAAALKSFGPEMWERIGGTPDAFSALRSSVMASRIGESRLSILRSFARVLLAASSPPPPLDTGGEEPLERLYHQMITSPIEAAEALEDAVVRCLEVRDFPGVEERLRLVQELPVTPHPELLNRAEALQRRYNIATLWHWQALNTRGYCEREIGRALLRELENKKRWLFQLRAPGGMGKTMFVHHTLGHVLSPAGVPCAHIDFDHVADRALALSEPWRLLIHAAEQLNRQLAQAPFTDDLKRWRQANAVQVPPGTASSDSASQSSPVSEDEVRTLFPLRIQEVASDQRIVIFLDTLEVAIHAGASLAPLLKLLEELQMALPALRVVLTGRFDLRQAELPPEQQGLLSDEGQVWFGELSLFQPAESKALLSGLRISDKKLISRIHKSSGGHPWLMVRMARFALRHPELRPEELDDFDMRYTVERVLSRIERKVQWAVLYAAVLRRFDRALLEELLAPLILAGIKGDREQTSAEGRSLSRYIPPSAAPPDPLFAPAEVQLDADWIWAELGRYASEGGWIVEDPAGFYAIQDDVAGPLLAVAALDSPDGADPQDPTGLLSAAARYWSEKDGEIPAREALWCLWRRRPQDAFAWASLQRDHLSEALAAELSAELLPEAQDLIERARSFPQRAAPRSWITGAPPELLALSALTLLREELRRWPGEPDRRDRLNALFKSLLKRDDALEALRAGDVPGFTEVSLKLLQAGLTLALGDPKRALPDLQSADFNHLSAPEQLDFFIWRGQAALAAKQDASRWLESALSAAGQDPRRPMIAGLLAAALEREGRLPEALALIEREPYPGAEEPPVRRVRLLAATGREDEALELASAWLARLEAGDLSRPEVWLIAAEVAAVFGSLPWPHLEAAITGRRGKLRLPTDPVMVRMRAALCDLDGARRALTGAARTPEMIALVARMMLFDERAPAELESLSLPADGSAEALRLVALRERGELTDWPSKELVRRELDASAPPPQRAARLLDALHVVPDPQRITDALAQLLQQIPDPTYRLKLLEGCAYLSTGGCPSADLMRLADAPPPPAGDDRPGAALTRLRLSHLHRVFGEPRRAAELLDPLLTQPGHLPLELELRVRRAARACDLTPPPRPFPTAIPNSPLEDLFWLLEAEARVEAEPEEIHSQASGRGDGIGRRARWMEVSLRSLRALGRIQEAEELTPQVAGALERAGRIADARVMLAVGTGLQEGELLFSVEGVADASLNRRALEPPPDFLSLVPPDLSIAELILHLSGVLGSVAPAVQRTLGAWLRYSGALLQTPHTLRLEINDLRLAALPWEMMRVEDLPLPARPSHHGIYRLHGTRPPQQPPVQLSQALVGEPARSSDFAETRALEAPTAYLQVGVQPTIRWGPGFPGYAVAESLASLQLPALIHLELRFEIDSEKIFASLADSRPDPESALHPETLVKSLRALPHLVLLETVRSRTRSDSARQLLLRNAFAHQLAAALHPDGAAVFALSYTDEAEREQQLPELLRALRGGISTLELARRCRAGGDQDPLGPLATALFTGQPDRELRL